MYLKCILNALLHSKRIHVSWFFACILHVSQTSPRYILGYISDTSGYMYLARGIHAGYMRDTYEIHVSAEVRGYMEDTCGIHERYIMSYMYLNCIQRGTYLQMYLVVSWFILMYLDVSWCILMYMNGTHQDTIRIHAGYIEIHQDTYPIGTPPKKG